MTSGRFKPYFVAILFLGIASGTALNLAIFTIPYNLSELGYSTKAIGAMFLTGLPYCLKPLWAPFIDKYSIPFLCKKFGQRRGWALFAQTCFALSVSLLLVIDPPKNLYVTAFITFAIAFFAATMDIILDAYRIERSETPQMLAAATTYGVIGMRFGMLVSSAGALFISCSFNWHAVYLVELLIALIGPVVILCIAEPSLRIRDAKSRHLSIGEYFQALKDSIILLKDSQPKLLMVMLMVILYKVSDSVPMAMSSPFFIDLSFSSYEIASVFKGYGFCVMIFGCTISGFLSSKMGITKSLAICGILQLLSPLTFMILSMLGYNFTAFVVTITIQNFVSGLAVTALSIYLSSLCNSNLIATQFSIIQSFNSLSRIILSSCAGFIAGYLEWTEFFIYTTLLGSTFIIAYYKIYGWTK